MKVTVAIPVYNDSPNISRCLESVLAQSYYNLEIIVSDNASTDNTLDLVKSYSADPRLVILTEKENLGCRYNFSKVLFSASSSRFMWLGSDDFLDKNAIERMVSYVDEKEKDKVIVPKFHLFDTENGKELKTFSFGMHRSGKIDKLLSKVFSEMKINYTYQGLYDTERLRLIAGNFPPVRSDDRFLNLAGNVLGLDYIFNEEARYFRGVKPVPFIEKNASDLIAKQNNNISITTDFYSTFQIRTFLYTLKPRKKIPSFKIEFMILNMLIFFSLIYSKKYIRILIEKLPLVIRSKFLRKTQL